jgi:hypothetical protein
VVFYSPNTPSENQNQKHKLLHLVGCVQLQCVCVGVVAGWSVPLDHHCNRSLVERGVARLACNCNQAGARADQDSVCGLYGVILCFATTSQTPLSPNWPTDPRGLH